MVRFCLRGLFASVFSQADNRSAKGSSLLGRSGTLNRGSTSSERRYLRMVFRDRPVLREISRIEKCSRKCQRRITLNNAMSITPYPLLKTSRGGSNMGQFSVEISLNAGSVLGGNQQHRDRMTDHQNDGPVLPTRRIRQLVDNDPVAFFRLNRALCRPDDPYEVLATGLERRYRRTGYNIVGRLVDVFPVPL